MLLQQVLKQSSDVSFLVCFCSSQHTGCVFVHSLNNFIELLYHLNVCAKVAVHNVHKTRYMVEF